MTYLNTIWCVLFGVISGSIVHASMNVCVVLIEVNGALDMAHARHCLKLFILVLFVSLVSTTNRYWQRLQFRRTWCFASYFLLYQSSVKIVS